VSSMGDPALVHRFTVEVDAFDLGSFTSCQGLQATYGLDAIQEGGSLSPSVQALKSVAYSDVTLQRPLDANSSALAAWFSAFASSPQPTTATIAAVDPAGDIVCRWNLAGVVPKTWSGPQWSSDQNAVAKESLVLAHTGFTMAS
jgi:phage tail-like protein